MIISSETTQKTTHDTRDWERIRADFPLLTPHHPRQAPCLPRQHRHLPKAPGRARRHGRLLPHLQRQHPPGRLRNQRDRHPPLRRSTRQDRPLHQRPIQPRDHLHPQHHRGHQPGGLFLGAAPTCTRATSYSSARWSTTPTSCPGKSSPASAASCCATSTSRRRGTLVLDNLRRDAAGRAASSAVTHMSNVLGTINPVERDHRRGARSRRARAARRRPERAPPACRTCRRSTWTSWPSPATRCAAPQASASSTASATCSKPCPHSWAAAT